MSDPKPLASLSAGLLARKGAARPAMRRQAALAGMGGMGGHDDLGWNDMGYDVDPQPAAIEPVRHGSHGLSPMAGHHDQSDFDADRGVMDDLDAAVDRGIGASPYEPYVGPLAVRQPRVEPIVPDMPVPTENDAMVVRHQQQRIADEIVQQPPVEQLAVVKAAVVDDLANDDADSAAVDHDGARPVAAVVPIAVARQPRPRAIAGARGAFAFTLRLDPERHLRLRLASAAANRSAQQILIGLVDEFLSNQPEITAFAAALPSAQAGR
jgi:hypothetical protein